ncbi:MAG: hypothetical protein ACTSQI_11290 [Candidatus Helarchaeota archaeon]
MMDSEIVIVFNLAEPDWFSNLSGGEKIELLRQIFHRPLNQVNFWDIYNTVRKLKNI